jgi:hypothetical protein
MAEDLFRNRGSAGSAPRWNHFKVIPAGWPNVERNDEVGTVVNRPDNETVRLAGHKTPLNQALL